MGKMRRSRKHSNFLSKLSPQQSTKKKPSRRLNTLLLVWHVILVALRLKSITVALIFQEEKKFSEFQCQELHAVNQLLQRGFC